MTINLGGELRFDTRGLPEGYDPHMLYEYRLDTAIKNSSGLESFLYKLMPLSLVKSFAFAIDPTAKFKVSPSAITPANRTRVRNPNSVLLQRKSLKVKTHHAWNQDVNYGLVSFCWSPYYLHNQWTDVKYDGPVTTQQLLLDRIKDTTSRTRLFGSDRGTLELFKGQIFSPPRSVARELHVTSTYLSTYTNEPLCGERGGTYERFSGTDEVERETYSPTAATLSAATYNQLRDSEITFCKALCQAHAVSMLKGITPFNRDYSLFRNLVELRDIPRSIASLQKTILDLSKVYSSLRHSPKLRKVIFNLKGAAKNVPNEYLSYHFGWKQTYKDAMDLLTLPEKTSKKINFLIRRSGKATTLRSKREFLSATGEGVSGFVYDTSEYEIALAQPFTWSRVERVSQVQLVVNCTWDFPPSNSVEFKRHVFAERIGLEPRVTDFYNLIPFTWLVDWFTGLGNYVELIDTINHDPSLINWGMISCKSTGSLITEISTATNIVTETRINNSFASSSTVQKINKHQSRFDYECITRSDVSTILDVKLTSVPSTLTAYQMSILGALIAQRAKFKL
jgi:hypothetical protein